MEEVIILKFLPDLTKLQSLELYVLKMEIYSSHEQIMEHAKRGIRDFMFLEESEQLENEQSI